MNKKNLFLLDNIINNKDNSNNEQKESKHPLLQIFFENNQKGKVANHKTIISKSPKVPRFEKSYNFNYKKDNKELDLEEKTVTPIKKKKNNRYILSKKKDDIYSYLKDDDDIFENEKNNNSNNNNYNNNSQNYETKNININNRGQNVSFDIYTVTNTTNNNSILPNLSRNTNLFRLKKKGIDKKSNIIVKNDLIYNNINFNNNSNSIFVSEAHLKKYPFFQRTLGNKVLNQKSMDSKVLTINSNNYSSLKNLNLKDYKFSNLRINTESLNSNNNNIYKIKKRNRNNLLFSFSNDKDEREFSDEKKAKEGRNTIDCIKEESKNNDQPNDIEENIENTNNKKSISTIAPKISNQDLKITLDSSNQIKKENTENNNKKKKIFLMKKNTNTNINKTNINKTNNEKTEIKEDVKENSSNKINKFYKLNNIDKTTKKKIKLSSNNVNNVTVENSKTNENEKENINTTKKKSDTKNIKDTKNMKEMTKPLIYYSNADINNKITLFSKYSEENKYELKIDEEKYVKKKRKKIIRKVNKSNESCKLYSNFNGAVKKYFMKNCVVNKITETIFDNFEPLGNKVIDINEKMKGLEKAIQETFKEILFHYHYDEGFDITDIIDIIDLLSFKEETKARVINNFGMFDIFKELLDQFKRKWNNQKNNDLYYQRLKQIYSLDTKKNDKNDEPEEEVNFFENIDRKFYIYKEMLRREYLLSLEPIQIKSKKVKKEKKVEINSTPSIKSLSSKKIGLALKKNKIRKCVSFKEEDQKKSTFSKIQKDYGFVRNTKSLDKFSKLYKISLFSRKSTKILDELSWLNRLKEKDFNEAEKDIENYNILKNPNLFHYNKNKSNTEKKMESKNKDNLEFNKRMIIDNMIIKFSGISQLTKEAAAIKTREMKQDSPFVKLFDNFVTLLKKREINQFIDLMQNESEDFKKMINKQEFSTGNTLLIYATQTNIKSLVELLLLKGADPNIQNNFGNTALHIAYSNNNTFIINLLLENHADQKLKNIKGLFPWQMAKNFND